MSTFDDAFALTVGLEGGYTANPNDRGNWTSGICGQGECKGTNFGISAMSYPTLDIAGLKIDAAKAIYKTDFWDNLAADSLPPAAAIVLFDYAINSGVGAKSQGRVADLQRAAGVTADGTIGPITMAAIQQIGGPKLAVKITAARVVALASLLTWATYRNGWALRMSTVLAAAIEHEAGLPAVTTYISPLPPTDQIKQAMREVLDERKAA